MKYVSCSALYPLHARSRKVTQTNRWNVSQSSSAHHASCLSLPTYRRCLSPANMDRLHLVLACNSKECWLDCRCNVLRCNRTQMCNLGKQNIQINQCNFKCSAKWRADEWFFSHLATSHNFKWALIRILIKMIHTRPRNLWANELKSNNNGSSCMHTLPTQCGHQNRLCTVYSSSRASLNKPSLHFEWFSFF